MPNRTASCAATYDGERCSADTQVLTWCRYHWQQQYQGRPFTKHRPRRMRGTAYLRDEQGRKLCGRCNEWRPEDDYTPSAKARDRLQSWCSPCASDYMTLSRYGIDRSRVIEMLNEQGGCGICRTLEPRALGFRNGWHVDHDHACCPGDRTCGKCVRGILCSDCNKMIGLAQDSATRLQQAIAYLSSCEERHESAPQTDDR